jgi:HD-like signal output (HDOD) protein
METIRQSHIAACRHCLDALSRKPEPLDETGCDVFRSLFRGISDNEALRKSTAFLQYHATEEACEEYCFRRMPLDEARRLGSHLEVCEPCRQSVHQHQEFITCLKAGLRISLERTKSVTILQTKFGAAELNVAQAKVPVSRAIGVQALTALRKPTASMLDIERVVSKDPVLAGHLIRVANSALTSSRLEVKSLSRALLQLGFEQAKLQIWGLSMRKLFSTPHLEKIWDHSVETAQITRQIAQMTGLVSAEEAALVALVHDIGQIVLAALGGSYESSFTVLRRTHSYTMDIERELCGQTHAEIGAALLESWQFAGDFASAVRWHHQPSQCGLPLTALLYLTEYVANTYEAEPAEDELQFAIERLKLNGADIEKLGSRRDADLEILRFAA